MTAADSRSEGSVQNALQLQRIVPHPRERVWRALTQSWLIEDWLMPSDFKAEVGHRFSFRSKPVGGWSGVTLCEVIIVDEPSTLSYTWNDEHPNGLRTVVTWTLAEVDGGTLIRLEQTGFGPGDAEAYRGLSGGWPHILERLEKVVTKG